LLSQVIDELKRQGWRPPTEPSGVEDEHIEQNGGQ
jgi:hypothetical protein